MGELDVLEVLAGAVDRRNEARRLLWSRSATVVEVAAQAFAAGVSAEEVGRVLARLTPAVVDVHPALAENARPSRMIQVPAQQAGPAEAPVPVPATGKSPKMSQAAAVRLLVPGG